MGRECHEVRDTSVRIFDAYVAISYAEDPRVMRDTCRLAFAAAASMILSSKLLCTKQPISPVSSFIKTLFQFYTSSKTKYICFHLHR